MSSEYPVIIIGAGIGGLAVAAYLSKQGIPSLLCEQGDAIGGRCSTREINRLQYEIGAVYVGGGAFDMLRSTFGITCPTIPIRVGIRVGKGLVSFPLGLRTLWELKRCGVPFGDLFRFVSKIRTLSNPSTFETCESVSEVLDRLTSNVEIRRFMDAMFGVSAVSPSSLPAHYLDGRSRVARYRAGNPEYIPGGNGEIPTRLFEIAKKNCTFLLNTRVTEIVIEKGNVRGIKTNRGEFFGRVVVSNAGLRPTVLHLTQKEHWPEDYYLKVKQVKRSLKVVNIFLTFSRSIKLPAGMSVFLSAVDVDMEREFQSLESGSFSEHTMFILQVPSNVEPHSQGHHRATLQFYYPAGEVSAQALESHVNRIMGEGLDTLFKGLSKAVTRYTVFDPARYQETFGFPPIVFGAAPDLHLNRFSQRTPVARLYCVGDSVAPDGPCVPQALESGIACARNVVEVLSHKYNIESRMKYDIIIIGAGIAGLSAAKVLAETGSLSVALVEHKSIGSNNPSPLTFPDVLENFGLSGCIKGSYSNFTFHNYRGSQIKYCFHRSSLVVLDYQKACLLLYQSLLESNNKPELIKKQAVGIVPEEGGVSVTFADQSRLQARLVIDCSGKSQLAASQFEKDRFSYYSHVYGAVLSGVKKEGDRVCCFLWPTGEFGLGGGWFYSLGEGSASFGYASISDSPICDSKELKEKFNAALKTFQPYSRYLENATIENVEFGTIPISYIKKFVYPGVVIVGDAAGMATNWTCMGVEPALKYGELAGQLALQSLVQENPALLNRFQTIWEKDNKSTYDRMAENAAKFWVSDYYFWEWIIKNDLARLSPERVLERMRNNSHLPKMPQILYRVVLYKLKSILNKNTLKPVELTVNYKQGRK